MPLPASQATVTIMYNSNCMQSTSEKMEERCAYQEDCFGKDDDEDDEDDDDDEKQEDQEGSWTAQKQEWQY